MTTAPPWGWSLARSSLRSMFFFMVLFFVAAPFALAGKKALKEEPPIVLQARSVAATDRVEALAILEDYLASNKPSRELIPWVLLNAGEQRRLSDDYDKAREHFVNLRDRFPEHPLRESAILGIAIIDSGERPSGNQLATMALIDPQGAPPSLQADRLRLIALDALARSEPAEKILDIGKRALAAASGDPMVELRVRSSLSKVPGLFDSPQAEGPLPGGEANLRRLRQAMESRDHENARRIAESYIATFPESPSAAEARYAIRRMDKNDPFKANVVGVMLPLSGAFAMPGARIKAILQMTNEQAGSPLTLVFKDEGATPESARAAVESLAMDSGAAIILGPLLKETAREAADTAQALRVPLLTFTQAEGITENRDFVFRGFLTPEQQIRALLDHAMGERGLKVFGILAPDTPFGHLVGDAFSLDVVSRGGPAPSSVYYDPGQGDFRKAAVRLAKKDPASRSGELARLRSQARARGMDPSKVVLPPDVHFDAIFIPDSAGRVPLVTSALAYEEFAVGTFKPKYHSVSVLVMGMNGWHHDSIAVDGGKYVRGGVFVDAFDPRDPSASVESFVQAARSRINEEPGIIEATVYDSFRIVQLALATHPGNRETMQKALYQVELKDPVAGGGRFNAEREVERKLLLFQVGSESVERWRGFEAPPEPEP